jgi:DNA-binding NarL/FixJ family response regulator
MRRERQDTEPGPRPDATETATRSRFAHAVAAPGRRESHEDNCAALCRATPLSGAMPDGVVVTVVTGRFEALVAHGLLSILGQDDRVRILASELESNSLKQAVRDLTPHVAIVDELYLPTLSCWVGAIRSATGVIVLARKPPFPYGMVLLAAGVTCVAGNGSVIDLLASVDVAGRGGCMFVSADGNRIERPERELEGILTKRENEVLEGLSNDRPYVEIAEDLSISLTTLRKHTTSLLRKLGASSKREIRGMPTFGNQADLAACAGEG